MQGFDAAQHRERQHVEAAQRPAREHPALKQGVDTVPFQAGGDRLAARGEGLSVGGGRSGEGGGREPSPVHHLD